MDKKATGGFPARVESIEFMSPHAIGRPPEFRVLAWPAADPAHLAP
jgi:hypothetical protein